MDFKDQIKILGDRVAKLKDNIATEEATKTAFILPFIQSLGYDVFDPTEVIPECICDVGTKKGEKIDYTICKDGVPIILIECKHWKQDLDLHSGQLLRYYHVSKAKFGILTNGINYRFYTDLIEPNIMDDKPFFEVNLEDIRDIYVEKLKEFHKSYFNIENILNTASELKFTNEIRNLIVKEVNDPSDEFIKYFARQVYPSMITKAILDQFRDIVKRSFQQYNSDYINDKLKSVIKSENVESKVPDDAKQEAQTIEDRILTTEEEKQGLYIVKSILHGKIDLDRIVGRDTISYFGILLDDNNRKPICRLRLNGGKKYIETFDEEKKVTKYPIETVESIYNYAEEVVKSAENYITEE
ncbi:MAG: type I restriction endonuclease [Bacteroidales bacterium]